MIKEKTRALYEKAIEWIRRRKFHSVKAKIDPFEKPRTFYRKRDDRSFTPDISAVRNGEKSFFDIVVKENTSQRLAGKWQLMQELAARSGGALYLLTPTGHKAFAERVIKDFNIKARIVNLA